MTSILLYEMKPGQNITQCQRCGTCCRKGGPTLHLEDRELVESGIIPLKQLLTIRQGEPAFDNVTNVISPATTDIIMIRAKREGGDLCGFYADDSNGCGIYAQRPAECRALQCWDTREIEMLYSCRRLTRRHLLSRVEGLWDLVQEHQQRCDYGQVAELASQLKQVSPRPDSEKPLLELIRYDESIRQLSCDRAGLDSEMLPFLFGRPLSFTIRMFQLKYVQTNKGFVLQALGKNHRQVCYRRQ